MAKWWQNLINAIDFFDLYHTDTETEMRNPSQPWSSVGDAVGKVYDDVTGNTAIDKSLEAQATENQKNREYNMMLWNQENAYNSPSAQKGRLEAAGLNADMMYGGSGVQNTASSPAPSTPMDWSSLANKKSPLQTAAEMASIENIRAVTDKIRSETKGLDIDLKYKDAQNVLGLQLTERQIKKYDKELSVMDEQIKEIQSRTANMDADTLNKIIEGVMRSNEMEHLIRKAKAEADMSESEARVALESELKRIAIYGHQEKEAEAKAGYAQFQEKSAWVPLAIQAAQLGINIFEVALKFKNIKEFFTSRPDLFPSTPPPAGN